MRHLEGAEVHSRPNDKHGDVFGIDFYTGRVHACFFREKFPQNDKRLNARRELIRISTLISADVVCGDGSAFA